MSSSTSNLNDKSRSKSALCRDVPALLGLHSRRQTSGMAPKNPSSVPPGASASSGFYKRLLEWLSRKNKSRRRFSEVASTDTALLKTVSSLRNQSAPMIFDILPHTVPQVVACSRIEESVQQPSKEDSSDSAADTNWVFQALLLLTCLFVYSLIVPSWVD